MLNILICFIRCTEVFEHVQKRNDDSKDIMHDKMMAEREISGKTSRFLNTFLQGTPLHEMCGEALSIVEEMQG